jgi:hypothetical protein
MQLLASWLWQLEPIPFYFFQRMISLVVFIEELSCMISTGTLTKG